MEPEQTPTPSPPAAPAPSSQAVESTQARLEIPPCPDPAPLLNAPVPVSLPVSIPVSLPAAASMPAEPTPTAAPSPAIVAPLATAAPVAAVYDTPAASPFTPAPASIPLAQTGAVSSSSTTPGVVRAIPSLPAVNVPSLTAAGAVPAVKKPTVFSLLKERYHGDKNRNRILDVIQLYLHQNGHTMAINETPLINGRVIDLSTLFLYVAGQGGFAKVDPAKGWSVLAVKMGYSGPGLSEAAGGTLRDVYSKIFLSFELQLSSKKAQQKQQQEQQQQQQMLSQPQQIPAPSQPVAAVSEPAKPSVAPPPAAVPTPPPAPPSAPAPVVKESTKSSKKRDRQQAQLEAAASESVASCAEKQYEAPVFSFNRNVDDKVLLSECVVDLLSKNVSDVVRGLNSLTLRSAEFDARALNLESCPLVVVALVEVLDLVNPAVGKYFDKALVDESFNPIQWEKNGINWNLRPLVYSAEVSVCY
jgi:hypothetical protein